MENTHHKTSWWKKALNLSLFGVVHARHHRCTPDGEEPPPEPRRRSRPRKCPEKTVEKPMENTAIRQEAVCRMLEDIDGETQPEVPGLLRYLHDQTQSIFPQYFQGAFLRVRQRIACNWKIGHNLIFSQVCPSGYKLSLEYRGDAVDLGMPYCMLELSPEGYTNMECRAAPTAGTRAAVVGQIAKNELVNWECFLDAYFSRSTISIITVNREMVALHYFQALGERLAVGGELMLWGGGRWGTAAAVRWRSDDDGQVASCSLGTRGAALCYALRPQPHLTFAARIEVDASHERPLGTLGYEYRGDGFTARGAVDSDGAVGGTLERRLGGTERASFSCALSALYNHANDKFQLGFGCTALLH